MLKQTYKTIVKPIAMAAVALTGILTGGCSLIHEDLDPCAVRPTTRTEVRFVYDYNTSDSDRFSQEVGGVTLYVFDSDDRLVLREEFNNTAHSNALKSPDFKIEFDSDAIEPGKRYTFYAEGHAHQAGCSGSLTMPGAAFRHPELQAGVSTSTDFTFNLDCDNDGYVDHDGVMIDALWTSARPVTVDVPEEIEPQEGDPQEPDHLIEVTVPLMRVTNRVMLTFWESEFPSMIDSDQYEVLIKTSTGCAHLNLLGEPVQGRGLKYKPVRVGTEQREIDGVGTACVCAEFGLSRIMLGSDLSVEIRHKASGAVTEISGLAPMLSKGNEAYAAKGWSAQEYLDREYDYTLDVALQNSIAKWVELRIDVLSWSKRYQLEDF